MRGLFLAVQCLNGFENTRDNLASRLVPLFAEAGFSRVSERRAFATIFGTLALYGAVKPERAAHDAMSARRSPST